MILRQDGISAQLCNPLARALPYPLSMTSQEPASMETATAPRRVEHQQTDKGYVPVYTTAVVEQPWDSYTADDHATWSTLYQRQRELLVGRASREFLQAQDEMGMNAHMIPRFDQLNEVLGAATGWTLVGVEGLLPELDFFDHLANRRFPVTWWIRRPDQIDYIAEPDMFHDLFGHVPLASRRTRSAPRRCSTSPACTGTRWNSA